MFEGFNSHIAFGQHVGVSIMHALQGLLLAQTDTSSARSERPPTDISRGGAADVLLGPGHSFGRNLARAFARRKGGLYCVLQCEGQTKHTAMVSGNRPSWKQELSFKSVQISSDLQVAIYQPLLQ